jgi:hypothetical protein
MVSFTLWLLNLCEKALWYPLDRMLGGPEKDMVAKMKIFGPGGICTPVKQATD